ncbi:HAD family hydrolase [Dysgonomonas sp. 520]|uniref:HAD family hydrolase n=1 Tax=Dysgonomonas sp. 520 TaxID=2302931 RepID=UPI0013CF5A7A|nr:HAD family hydrolase [Dysgonomonas sp. 520]NDW09605.1 HAD family hydrolase [Dysgonomonas sp. 520]
MINIDSIKGIIFDYGGTIDSNGKHWAEVLWEAYEEIGVPVSKEQFREAYVYAERYLATHPVIGSEDNFKELLLKKVDLQVNYLVENKFLSESLKTSEYSLAISNQCYNFVRNLILREKSILEFLHKNYPMVLVSNFYGNVQAVLEDFGLLKYFNQIIESAVVGVRKPDPAIFALGVEALGLPAEEVVVIGDSYTKDIVPASKNGCKTIWLKGKGWGDDEPDATADIIITDFMELRSIFSIG